jgi:hypothetical protein
LELELLTHEDSTFATSCRLFGNAITASWGPTGVATTIVRNRFFTTVHLLAITEDYEVILFQALIFRLLTRAKGPSKLVLVRRFYNDCDWVVVWWMRQAQSGTGRNRWQAKAGAPCRFDQGLFLPLLATDWVVLS